MLPQARSRCVTYDALGVDVRDIGGNTWATLDVVQRKLADSRVELKEEGQRLTNATSGTEDGDLGGLQGCTVSQ